MDRLIIDSIEKGLDFNYIFEKFINGNLSNIIDFINSHEYLLSHPINPLTPNDYLIAALRLTVVNNDGMLDQEKLKLQSNMLEKAFIIGADIDKIGNENFIDHEILEFNKERPLHQP